jgi:hypothetical protein
LYAISLTNCIFKIIHNNMPPKSTRIRKPSNRVPTSLAAVVATSSPDPLLQSHTVDTSQIDPWLLELNVGLNPTQDALNTIEPHAFDSIELSFEPDETLDTINVIHSPFSDGFIDAESIRDSRTPPLQNFTQSSNLDNNTIRRISGDKKSVTWSDQMEAAMFHELINQANNGKRADSGLKREAWVAACTVVRAVSGGQDVSIDQCKSKVEGQKARWRDFHWLQSQSGFGYNEGSGLITAGDQAWEDIILV